ncbi:MAG: LytTR family DNA-binding domain-containing protein [Bacteroidota bacterium]
MDLDTQAIKVLIVDDEKKACINLQNLLAEFIDADVNVVGIANSTKEAEAQIALHNPDAVFLDIHMPNENAFHFLDRIAPFNFEVIFVTAYDEYAVRAFKLNAIDYILKPISIKELAAAVQKLKERLKYKTLLSASELSFAEVSGQVANKLKPTRITLRGINKIEVVDFRDIYFLEAQSSYSKILFTRNNKVREMTMSNPLSDYEEILPMNIFYRIHRSYLVNCSHITSVVNDESKIVIEPDFILPVSRRRFGALIDFLKTNDFYNE